MAKFKEIRVARPASWAIFRGADQYGNPKAIAARICYWGLTYEGDLVPLIADDSEGLRDARTYSNFVDFQHDRRHRHG